MKTSEILQLQALKLKRQVLQDNPDMGEADRVPEWMRDSYDASGESRNICAMVPVALFEEIQRLSDVMSISKRRMVELALRDIAIDANRALGRVGFDPASMATRTIGAVPIDEE